MKEKLYILLLTVGLFSLLSEAQAGTINLTDSSALKASKILNFDKIKRIHVLKPIFSGDFQQKTETVVRAQVAYIENSPLADYYRSQPVLFGFLTMFTVVSLGALGFIFHLIRGDPRYF
ncbi:MAG: hypothetical protein ISR85_03115 [Kiritimatiellales bacterium]|nr:hypothetical protein [Kiritimatiellota bacterium]MBL7011903.1 hypothetical protein [Kiritimatiellales bacterium]